MARPSTRRRKGLALSARTLDSSPEPLVRGIAAAGKKCPVFRSEGKRTHPQTRARLLDHQSSFSCTDFSLLIIRSLLAPERFRPLGPRRSWASSSCYSKLPERLHRAWVWVRLKLSARSADSLSARIEALQCSRGQAVRAPGLEGLADSFNRTQTGVENYFAP